MALGLTSLRTQLLIPTKGRKRAGCLYIGHQQGPLSPLKKEKETLKNMAMIFSIRFSRMGRWQKATRLMKSEKMHSWISSRTWRLIRLCVSGLLCVQCVCTYVRVCVRLCVCTNSHCTDVWVCLWYTAARLFVGLWTYCPFYFSQCLDDLNLENTITMYKINAKVSFLGPFANR